MTAVETEQFLKSSSALMTEQERIELVVFVASNPQSGDLMPGTGGVRKLRWGLQGRGKRGGARVIYYFHNERMPVLLLEAYGKNTKSDLSQAERNAIKKRIPILVDHYLRRTRT